MSDGTNYALNNHQYDRNRLNVYASATRKQYVRYCRVGKHKLEIKDTMYVILYILYLSIITTVKVLLEWYTDYPSNDIVDKARQHPRVMQCQDSLLIL